MKNLILSALGIGKKPEAQSALVPAYGDFPAGARVGIVTLGTTWEILHHPPEKLFSIRHLDDRDHVGPCFQLDEEHIADIVVEKGRILHPKKIRMLLKGQWVDGLRPGTYFSATDRPANGSDPKADQVSFDQYVLRYADLIDYLTAAASPLWRGDATPQADKVPADGDSHAPRT